MKRNKMDFLHVQFHWEVFHHMALDEFDHQIYHAKSQKRCTCYEYIDKHTYHLELDLN